MKNECDKHPEKFDDYTPRQFAEKFVKTNYFFQKNFFELLPAEYRKEAEADKERNSLKDPNKKRTQLASGLEELAKVFEFSVLKSINKICNACKNYMKNPYKE